MLLLNRINTIFLLLTFIILLVSCNSNTKLTEQTGRKDSLAMANPLSEPVIKREAREFRNEINYTLDTLTTWKEIDSLFKEYSSNQLKTILALNRVDKNRLRPKDEIVIPECASEEFNDYSPLPENINSLQCIPKTVLISQRVQAFGLYENGELIKWGPVSSGKRSTQTPGGLNYGNYKAKKKISTVDDSWILPYYFNFMNFEGIGVHQYAMPGYPASHGCVRLYMEDAKYIFDWAEMWEIEDSQITKNGTPFMVFGKYDYGSEKPWLDLTQNMKANDLTQDELNQLEAYLWEYQQDPRNFNQVKIEKT